VVAGKEGKDSIGGGNEASGRGGEEGKASRAFWNEESAREWYREVRTMLGEKSKYRNVLAGDLDRTYYMLPHIPHTWKVLEKVGAMKEVMGGLVINDEVMDEL